MRLDQYLALASDTLLISVRPGRINEISYDAGTVGRISRNLRPDEAPEIIIHFTRTASFDFAHFEKRNWEVLRHCSRCGSLEIELSKCTRCYRPDYCRLCLSDHHCHIPAVGLSREPRREKQCQLQTLSKTRIQNG